MSLETTRGLMGMDTDYIGYKSNQLWERVRKLKEKAFEVISSDRALTYDTPEDNFSRIADVWNALLDEKMNLPLTEGDVARMMIGVKLVRDAHAPKYDNRVDILGYGMCLERVEPTDD